MLSVALFLVVRVALFAPYADNLTRVDSRRLQSLAKADLISEQTRTEAPQILIMGTSRLMPLRLPRMEERLGLPPGSSLNLSSPGADFFYLETVLRRNPALLTNASALVIDLLPLQAADSHNFDERGEFFLRYATLGQRLASDSLPSKAVGVADLIIPARSHAQSPHQWRTVIQELNLPTEERLDRISTIPMKELSDWAETTRHVMEARNEGNGFTTIIDLFFPERGLIANQVNALDRIIESLPDSCQLILVWLPFREDARDHVAQSPAKTRTQNEFRGMLEGISDPQVSLHWFERPEDMGLRPEFYAADGAHFTLFGMPRVSKRLAELIEPHLPPR